MKFLKWTTEPRILGAEIAVLQLLAHKNKADVLFNELLAFVRGLPSSGSLGRVCVWLLAARKTHTSTARKMPSTIYEMVDLLLVRLPTSKVYHFLHSQTIILLSAASKVLLGSRPCGIAYRRSNHVP